MADLLLQCQRYNGLISYSFLYLQEKPKPVAQRNKKPWKPEDEDEEFTANEDEGEHVVLGPGSE